MLQTLGKPKEREKNQEYHCPYNHFSPQAVFRVTFRTKGVLGQGCFPTNLALASESSLGCLDPGTLANLILSYFLFGAGGSLSAVRTPGHDAGNNGTAGITPDNFIFVGGASISVLLVHSDASNIQSISMKLAVL